MEGKKKVNIISGITQKHFGPLAHLYTYDHVICRHIAVTYTDTKVACKNTRTHTRSATTI